MKFLSILALCCAAASASPVAFNISLADDRLEHLTQGADEEMMLHGVELSKRDNIFQQAQDAAGSTARLRTGKSYYFMSCNPYQTEQGDMARLEPAYKWVRDQTRTKRTPHGCSHVGLVVGTVKKKGNCLSAMCAGSDKTFEGMYWHVLIDRTNTWMQMPAPVKATRSAQWFFKGEVPATVRMGTDLHSALDVTGEKWIDKAGTAFNENFNCLTYYNSLVQTHFK